MEQQRMIDDPPVHGPPLLILNEIGPALPPAMDHGKQPYPADSDPPLPHRPTVPLSGPHHA